MRLATIRERTAARFIDTGLAGAIGLFVYLGIVGHRSIDPVTLRVGFSVGLFFYHFLFECGLAGGQTPGKRLFGITVVNRDGKRLSPGESFSRSSVLPSLIGLIGFPALGLGLLSLIFPFPNRRCLHDLLAGSLVVRLTPVSARSRAAAEPAQMAVRSIHANSPSLPVGAVARRGVVSRPLGHRRPVSAAGQKRR